MTHLEKLVFTLAIIFISLALGYGCRHLSEKGILPFSELTLARTRVRLQAFAAFGLIPISAMLSLWGLPKPDSELLALPFLGLIYYIWGGILALLAAKAIHLTRAQTGSFFCCASFGNVSAIGALVCLVFIGENSIALVALYRLLEEVYYFGAVFPIARRFAPKDKPTVFHKSRFNPIPVVIVLALGAGIALNLCHVPRAPFLGTVASACMLMGTIFFLFTIGLSLRIIKAAAYARPGLVMCAIKFIGVPLFITFLAWLLGCATYDNGLALKTVAIISAMPVAMTSLVPPSLFGLDIDLANACWIITTLGLVFVLPVLMMLLPLL